MTDRRILPPGLTCPECSYDLALAAVDRCSECGVLITETDIEMFAARTSLVERWRAHVLVYLAATAVVIAVMGVGAAVVGLSLEAGVAATLGSGFMLFSAPLAGLVVLRLARPDHRRAYLLLWTRSTIWLHAPWLVIPACTAVIAGAAAVAQLLGRGGDLIMTIAALGLLLWISMCMGCMLLWANHFGRACRRVGLRSKKVLAALTLLAIVTIIGSAMFGVAGGALATDAAMSLAGGESFF